MSLYAYTGRSARGEPVKGRMEADSADGVATRLIQGGITPIDIVSAVAEASGIGPGTDLGELARRLGLGRPSTADLIFFTRQMFTITKSGIPLLRGLRGLVVSTRNATLRHALEEMIASLEGGRTLSESFAQQPRVFSPLYVGMVAVGEQTGTLENSFLRLGQHLAHEQDIHDRVKNALRYPLIVVLAIAVAIGIVTTFVIPRFAPLFRALGNEVPWPTRVIMGVSELAQNYWHIGLAATVLFAIGLRQAAGTAQGRLMWHRLKLRIPVIGKLIHQAILARVTRTLSVSLAAGVPMLETLATLTRSAGNDHIAARIEELRTAVERGEPLARAASATGIFPPLVLQMIAVGEETGELSALLEEVAGFYEREVDYSLKVLSAAFEPVLLACVGAMVLILALGVFLPMWNLIAKVGSGH
ncbi:MAG TPA: type II secretion system F family protein [Steroidobacteraceae bacterium]|nr:type II secretion system F family protein [Steroidobacteraceae bacterium]